MYARVYICIHTCIYERCKYRHTIANVCVCESKAESKRERGSQSARDRVLEREGEKKNES